MEKNSLNASKIALFAILTALALALSLLEQMIPLGMIIPIPGIRLGLSNIITMFAIFYLGAYPALLILLCRIFLLLLLSGNVSSFFLSLCGGLLALLVMFFLKRWAGRYFSLFGVSIGGACAHNIGQIIGASLLLSSKAAFYYLPVLLITGTATGILTAFITSALFLSVDRSRIFTRYHLGSKSVR
ncbi:MAG: Gx transporter family protein [Clostridiales bacterium]|nr:Gx transporter family protein [Clostridiales bacterium]